MDFYVSLNGNDANSGGVASPLRTISKALTKTAAGDRVVIREGLYRGNVGWFPGNATAQLPISIEAYPGESVTISAFSILSGWEPVDLTNGKAIYRTQMPFTMCSSSTAIAGEDLLLWNGQVLNEAQWPSAKIEEYPQSSKGWASVDAGRWITDPNASEVTGTIEDADLAVFATNSLVGSYITILPGARWTLLSGTVTANQANSLTFICKSPGSDSVYVPNNRSLYFLFGKQELLLCPGSWWRDPSTNYVYIWLPDSSNPNNSLIEAKKDDKLFDFWSRSFYHFKDINFIGATVHTPNVAGFRFSGCRFKHFNHRLYFSTVWSWFKPGIFVTGDDYVIKDCDFLDSIGPAVTAVDQNNLAIENCTISNCMTVDFAGVNGKFIQNTMSGTPGPCLRLYKNCTGSEITKNDLGFSGRMYTDEGVFLVSKGCIGGNSRASYNYIHDGMGLADGSKEFYGSSGIYFDSETSGITFDHNIVVRTTSGSVSLVCGNGIDSMLFYSNTFDSESGIYWVPKDYGGKLTGCKFINNYARKRGDNTRFHPDVEYARNAFKVAPSDEGLPLNNFVVGDPKFNSDYSLQSDSPLKSLGVSINGITTTNPPEVGAWEGGRSIIGAVVRQKDLTTLQVSIGQTTSSLLISILNLPMGRKVGDDFGLMVGDIVGTRVGEFSFVAQGSIANQSIFARANALESWIKIGEVIPSALPTISGISPASGISGDLVHVTGSGFVSGSTVMFDSQAIPTQFIDSTSISFVVP